MSLIIQSLMGSNAMAGNTSSSATGGTAGVAPFSQTLVQTMGGNATQATPPVLGNLASLLLGLLGTAQQTGEAGEDTQSQQHADLLEGLTEELEKLDESISTDPALQAALQGWILQVSALLSGNSNHADPTEGDRNTGAVAGGLPLLAQQPDTLRFAVQDELNSLVTMIQQAAVGGNEENATKGIALVNQFSALLEQVPVQGNSSKSASSSASNSFTTQVELSSGTDSMNKAQEKTLPILNPLGSQSSKEGAAPASVASPQGLVEVKPESTVASAAKAVAATETSKTALTEAAPAEAKVPEVGDHEIITAGQLSLRGGITGLHKADAPAPQVPVQQFAQEMTGFITGKLEIVKKGGLAEATISLFPEHLGQVDVKITMQNGHLVAQFLTEHAATKDMLEQQMTQLRAALQSQGLQVEKLEVTQNNTPLQSQFGQDGRQPGSSGQQQSGNNRSKQRSEDTGDAVLAAELSGEWREWVAGEGSEERDHRSSFSAKA